MVAGATSELATIWDYAIARVVERCAFVLLERPMLHLKCQLSADPFEVSLNLIDASQGRLNIRQYILGTHAFQKI